MFESLLAILSQNDCREVHYIKGYTYSVAAQAHNVKAMVDLVSMGGRGHNIKLSPQYKGQLYIILVLISLPTMDLYHISPHLEIGLRGVPRGLGLTMAFFIIKV